MITARRNIQIQIFCALLISTHIGYATQPSGLLGIQANYSALDPKSVRVEIKCYSLERFAQGLVYMLVSADSGSPADSLVLWTGQWNGDPNKETFNGTFSHSFTSQKSVKSFVKVGFRCLFAGETKQRGAQEQSFLWHLADTIITYSNSFDGLEDEEIRYEMHKGGYDTLTDKQFRKANGRLWKRYMRRHGVQFKDE